MFHGILLLWFSSFSSLFFIHFTVSSFLSSDFLIPSASCSSALLQIALVLPSHKPWLVVQGLPGQFLIDHAHPFGAACASSNAGMIANAVVNIWHVEGIFPVPKYEDDLKVFRIPSPMCLFHDSGFFYDYDCADMLCCIHPWGVPWHDEKGDDHFLFVTTFIGFCWDIPRKLVSLPEEKQLKFHEHVWHFLCDFKGWPCHLLNVKKIHGSLCHVAFVYMDHSYLPSLSNFASSFHNNEVITRYPPHSMMTDLGWWLKKLEISSISRALCPRGSLQDLGLYVDASTSWGIGIIIGDSWASFQLSPTWKVPGRDICWLETLAIELLIYFLEQMGLRHCCLLIHSDNQDTISALEKGRSPNSHINLSVCHTYLALSDLSISPDIVYIESVANLADPILCREPGEAGRQIFPTFTLPEELTDSFLHV